MKIGVISDIEGNHEKLAEVLFKLKDCRLIVNLGDSVGGRGDSDKVIEMLQAHHVNSVMGNHDLEVILNRSVPADAHLARMMPGNQDLYHPRVSLTRHNLDYLKTLKMRLRVNFGSISMAFQHAICGRINGALHFDYVSIKNFSSLVSQTSCKLNFIGHKHIPAIFILAENNGKRSMVVERSMTIPMANDAAVAINVGSIGAPRNNAMQYSYGVIDLKAYKIGLEVEK